MTRQSPKAQTANHAALSVGQTSQTKSTKTTSPVRKPTHRLYHVTGEGGKAVWTAIGAAWPNKDGKGFSLLAQAIPLGGSIVIRAVPQEARYRLLRPLSD